MRSPSPRLSAVMIARDEQGNIERCFSSLWGACDELVLADTGSRDGTVAAARRFARERGEPGKLKVGHFKWRADWAAARNYADSLATGHWLLRMDLDETIKGARDAAALRALVDNAPDELTWVSFWSLQEHAPGGLPRRIKRWRLVRAGAGAWTGRVDEGREYRGGAAMTVPPEVCEFVHHRRSHSYRKNYEQEAQQSADPHWVLALADGAREAGEHGRAIALFQEYAEITGILGPGSRVRGTGDLPEIARQVMHRLALLLGAEGRYQEARALARQMIRRGLRGLGNVVLAEVEFAAGDMRAALRCADLAIEFAEPREDEPLDHIVVPRVRKAVVLAELGREEDALVPAREVLALYPDHPEMQPFKEELLRREPLRTAMLGLLAAMPTSASRSA
jgi:tetratricopeptide (TPR) repeat protein